MNFDEDFALALKLQHQFENERRNNESYGANGNAGKVVFTTNKENEYNSPRKTCIVDSSWEYIDPTPDIHALFTQFDKRFFWGKLKGVEVRWSPRMTSCAGVCCYEGHGGLCSVRLSLPLLKLRPRKDLVETLLHEMIHAYLFVTHNNRDRDGHGPEFHKHMHRINKEAGTNISVYHSFHNEVKLYQQHWWRCDGPCKSRPPYFGMVKRSMNRAPGPSDFWWKDHEQMCGGRYTKVREPEGFSEKKAKEGTKKTSSSSSSKSDIRNFFPFHGKGNTLGSTGTSGNMQKSVPMNSPLAVPKISSKNIVGFNDLAKNTNSSGLPTKKTKEVSDGKVKINGYHTGGNKPSNNFPGKKPVLEGNNSGLAPGRPSNVKSGGFGGMLANKGGGTLVITDKGNNKSDKNLANVRTLNGSVDSKKEAATHIVPFSGQGYTLGSGVKDSKTNGLLSSGKPKSSFLRSSGTGSKLLNKTSSSESSRTLLNESKGNKRHSSSDTEETEGKKNKNGSFVDLTSDTEDCSPSKGIFVNCPICGAKIKEVDINSHLDSCLGSSFDEDSPCTSKVTEETSKLNSDSDLVKCPVCNKEMLKCDTDIHLEKCLESVFGGASVMKDEWADEESCADEKPGDTSYPCPCCPAMVKDVDMNTHLDKCLSKALSNEEPF